MGLVSAACRAPQARPCTWTHLSRVVRGPPPCGTIRPGVQGLCQAWLWMARAPAARGALGQDALLGDSALVTVWMDDGPGPGEPWPSRSGRWPWGFDKERGRRPCPRQLGGSECLSAATHGDRHAAVDGSARLRAAAPRGGGARPKAPGPCPECSVARAPAHWVSVSSSGWRLGLCDLFGPSIPIRGGLMTGATHAPSLSPGGGVLAPRLGQRAPSAAAPSGAWLKPGCATRQMQLLVQ